MMKVRSFIPALALLLVFSFCGTADAQQPVRKTNPMKVYMHYMPWFETPETTGGWGWHWTMNNRDPDRIVDGRREIASHYYPLIGPYASRDRDVIEYHLLLMKLSGVDGILIDWYGTEGSNGDLKDLLISSDSIVSRTGDFGMQFGVVLEDRFSRSVDEVKANMAYLKDNYFSRDEYIRTGDGNDPLVCIFGPITFEDPADWTEILPAAGEEIEFLTLWYSAEKAGANADGEFMWIYQDEERNHLEHMVDFYTGRAPGLATVMGVAYPGFNDFYDEGGAGPGYFYIPHYYGSTLAETFNKAGQYRDDIDMLQLATFNDFGEGTMFEPTRETGFDYMVKVQEYTGVDYGEADLKVVHRLYVLRKFFADDAEVQQQLDQASLHLGNLEIEQAHQILESIMPTGMIRPADPREGTGMGIRLFPNPVTDGRLNVRLGNNRDVSRIAISDMNGRIVYSGFPGALRDNFTIENIRLPHGVYLLMLENGDLPAASARFSITR